MPVVVYYEQTKKGKQVVWIEKVLITTNKDKVVYDGEFRKYDNSLLKLIEQYSDNYEEFKKKHNLI
jgi:hypothetical protein